jgi:cytochrome c-type protein NapB
MSRTSLLLGACLLAVSAVAAAERVLTERLYGNDEPMAETRAPQLPKPVTDGTRTMRNYPEQPPVIPHDISGYELSVEANTCLTCHRREYTRQTGAPMISITHYRNREGQTLADVAPRRYFCTQCHVPQTMARPLIENTFTNMSELTGSGE